jgi:RNA 2',3'-cyclic 3'-phosphodiesterase
MSVPDAGTPSRGRRLFFASWPTDELRVDLGQVLPKIEWASGGRRVSVANYHLTLAFLGDVPATRVDAVREAVCRVRSPAFDLHLDRIEYWSKPQVLCLAASAPPDAARTLVQGLWRVLDRAGFKADVRPFKAHLTLARKVERPPANRAIDPITWRVDRLALVESIGTPEGPVYTPLVFWPLTSSST